MCDAFKMLSKQPIFLRIIVIFCKIPLVFSASRVFDAFSGIQLFFVSFNAWENCWQLFEMCNIVPGNANIPKMDSLQIVLSKLASLGSIARCSAICCVNFKSIQYKINCSPLYFGRSIRSHSRVCQDSSIDRRILRCTLPWNSR